MATAIPQPPLPRQPLGRTFIVAVSLLGVFALLQLIAILVHFAPLLRQQLAESATRSAEARSTPVPKTDDRTSAQAAKPQDPGLSMADTRQFQKLLTEADSRFRVGDYDGALKTLDEAAAMQADDPKVLLLRAQVLERLDQPEEAVAALEAALRVQGLPPQVRAMAQRKIDQLSQNIGGDSTKTRPTGGGDEELRENGLQPGASLGIVDVKLRDSKVGAKSLRVAVKSRPGSNINVKDVKILVYFYEETEDGEVVLTDSKVVSQWLSPPIDWAGDEPEILEMQYSTPDAQGNDGPNVGRKFHGYTVGIYYNSELQDFRADPGKLAKDFPLPLYLPQNN